MGNHPSKKFSQGNYNGEDILHSNRQRSEYYVALEEDETFIYILFKKMSEWILIFFQ